MCAVPKLEFARQQTNPHRVHCKTIFLIRGLLHKAKNPKFVDITAVHYHLDANSQGINLSPHSATPSAVL